MTIVLTSPSVIAPKNTVDKKLVTELNALANAGFPIGVTSNHAEPAWFAGAFPGKFPAFVHRVGRQDGKVVGAIAANLKMATHNVVVLGATDVDLQMAKNGGAVLVVAAWAAEERVQAYGLSAESPDEFSQVLNLVSQWPGKWYFDGQHPWYRVLSLANVSGYGVGNQQQAFAAQVVATIKNGGPELKALLAVAARSMLISGVSGQSKLMFGYYPSSSSTNDDSDVLSDFTHRLRTVTSRVKLAKLDNPLFIRHRPSTKRSTAGKNVNRTDPSEQIETIHLNPLYRKDIKGRHVVVVDDCTTYGVSFGVAAGFLKAAGATGVTGLALGKFGKQLRYYEVTLESDPFAPVAQGEYSFEMDTFHGSSDDAVQLDLRKLLSQ